MGERGERSTKQVRIRMGIILGVLLLIGAAGIWLYNREVTFAEYQNQIGRIAKEQQRFIERNDVYGSQLKIGQAEQVYDLAKGEYKRRADKLRTAIDSMYAAHNSLATTTEAAEE
ncbi:MAG: hypothetical protein IKA81_04670 [Alistipes sp.]|nr:hypothetical protein [Alistipes sp.]